LWVDEPRNLGVPIFPLYLFTSLENVVLAERTCGVHLEPFHNACTMEMMVAGKSMELCSILIWAETYTTFLEKKKVKTKMSRKLNSSIIN
jgi:hypothetical protein